MKKREQKHVMVFDEWLSTNNYYKDVVKDLYSEYVKQKNKEYINEIEVEYEEIKAPDYYDNSQGSLYKIAEQRKWDSYQFDIIKRIDRCKKKGEFESDLDKSEILIALYRKENNE